MNHRMVYASLALAGCLTACGDDKIVSVVLPDLASLTWSLQTDIKATTITIGGHQKLVATPRDVAGNPILGAPAATFLSTDPTKVTVDGSGLLTGVAVTSGAPVSVIGSLTTQGITYTDTTMVAVTAGTSALKSVTLVTGGDPVVGINASSFLSVTAVDENNVPIPDFAYSIVSLDGSSKADLRAIGGGLMMLTGHSLGQLRLVASTTSYGITKADTVVFTVQYSMHEQVLTQQSYPSTFVAFSPNAIVIGVGGSVQWYNFMSQGMNVTFDGSLDNIVGGNITDLPSFSNATRTFLAAGTYTYKSTTNGATGKVIVREQPQF